MLQRRYHPDSGSEADAKKSADINRAYDILTDKSARVRLDDALMRSNDGKRRRAARTVVSASGLVGPLRRDSWLPWRFAAPWTRARST